MRSTLLIPLVGALSPCVLADGPPPTFDEGEITLRIKSGRRESTLRYLKKGSQLRIDKPGRHIPAPAVNLVDLRTGIVTLLRPHNGTWTAVPAERLRPGKVSAFPPPPKHPGIGAHPAPPGTPGRLQPTTTAAPTPAADAVRPGLPKPPFELPGLPPGVKLPPGIGPQPDGDSPKGPGFPKFPDLPADLPPGIGPRSTGVGGGRGNRPEIPNLPGIPAGVTGGFADGIPGLSPPVPSFPAFPAMPPMMPGEDRKMTLTPGKEKRVLHGYPCRQFTLTIPGEGVMTLWLSEAEDLPPFYPLMHEAPRRQGRIEWRRQWPALLREKHLFPLLAILRSKSERDGEQGEVFMRMEVTDITPGEITDADGTTFKVPDEFHKMELPSF